jgi:hypothetical protein
MPLRYIRSRIGADGVAPESISMGLISILTNSEHRKVVSGRLAYFDNSEKKL